MITPDAPASTTILARVALGLGVTLLLCLWVTAHATTRSAAATVRPHTGAACAQTAAFAYGSAAVGIAATSDDGGYWVVNDAGQVAACGDAAFFGQPSALNRPVVGIAATPDGAGYYLVASDGGVFAYGDAAFRGSTGSLTLNKPIVGMAVDPVTGGYWLVASDGGIFAFGAPFLGSTGAMMLNEPVVGMAAAPNGSGYWLVASDGGVFAYGVPFLGSTGSIRLNKPVVGMAADPATGGYWSVASDGGVFAFGAPFFGSTGAMTLNKPVVGMEASPTGRGYRFVAADGGVFSYNSPFYGTPIFALPSPVGTTTTAAGGGTPAPNAPPSGSTAMMIPNYVYPAYYNGSENVLTGAWETLATTPPDNSNDIVIANVDTGPCNYSGTTCNTDPNYTMAIHAAVAEGWKIYGYVDTGYLGEQMSVDTRDGSDSESAWVDQAETDETEWHSEWGGDISGLFLDDVTGNAADLSTYEALATYDAAYYGDNVILNPGDAPASNYTTAGAFDAGNAMQFFEGCYNSAGVGCLGTVTWNPGTVDYAAPGYRGVRPVFTVYATPSSDLSSVISTAESDGAEYLYVSDQDFGAVSRLPNGAVYCSGAPFCNLPSYFSAENSDLAN